jgi:hypothetical protein
VRALVDRALDRVFDEPFDIRSDDDFARVMLEHPNAGRAGAAAGALAGFIAIARPMAERGLRFVRTSGKAPVPAAKAAKYAAIALPITIQLGSVTRQGVRELQVLASYVIHRFRAEGIVAGRDTVQAVTLSLYLDPERPVDLTLTPGRASGRLMRTWAFRSLGTDGEVAVHRRTRALLDALDRLDFRALPV